MSRDERLVLKKKIPLTVNEMVHSSMEDINDLYESHDVTEEQINICRDIRRRGKNKESINARAKFENCNNPNCRLLLRIAGTERIPKWTACSHSWSR